MKLGSMLLLAAVWAAPFKAHASVVDDLATAGKLEIPLARARTLEAELGQLFVINVDGFGYAGSLALAPAFADLVTRLQVGGVIPHYGSADYERIVRTNRALASLTSRPLLICSDIVTLRMRGRTASFGDGYVGGFLGRFRLLSDAALETLGRLNAFVFAALGVNVALGPTVDSSTGEPRVVDRALSVIAQMRRYGIEPVIKHFPALPIGANLHRESPDTELTREAVEQRSAIFGQLADDAGIMMTTHYFDTRVDPGLVTFSGGWIGFLRARTGFGGLLMSDGLLMLRSYRGGSVGAAGSSWPADVGGDAAAVWGARALMAGHDLLVVEGSAARTSRAFSGVLELACRGTEQAAQLASRIDQSFERINRWKKERASELRRTVKVPSAAVSAVIDLLPPDGAELASFRFNGAALARLEPSLRAAESRR